MTRRPYVAGGLAGVALLALGVGALGHWLPETDSAWTDVETAGGTVTWEAPETPDPGEGIIPGIPPGEDPGSYIDQDTVDDLNRLPGLNPLDLSEPLGYDVTFRHPYDQSTDFCFTFDVTTDADVDQWELTFDTSQPPFGGWKPYTDNVASYTFPDNNEYTYGNWETLAFDESTSQWTIGGTTPAGGSVQGGLCPTKVPDREVTPAAYTWEFSASGDWSLGIGVRVETDVSFFIPWQAWIDLEDYFCPASLENDLVFDWDPGFDVHHHTEHVYRISRSTGEGGHLVRAEASYPGYGNYQHFGRFFVPNENVVDHRPPNC